VSADTAAQPLIGFAMDTLVIERWESDRNILLQRE
jgi:ABC-type xylose transport system substrate-binding protein